MNQIGVLARIKGDILFVSLSEKEKAVTRAMNAVVRKKGKYCPICKGKRWVYITPNLATPCDCRPGNKLTDWEYKEQKQIWSDYREKLKNSAKLSG